MTRAAVVYYLPLATQGARPAVPDSFAVIASIEEPDPQARTGLRGALAAIRDNRAETLFLPRLGDAVRSFGELIRLLDWLEQAGVELVAADVGLDTTTDSGQATLAMLREIERWEREADRPRRPPGRPGLASVSPELAQQIGELRERGLSLQGIADELNRRGVPTPRGGAGWRPSSVQSVLGYRRPRPPLAGAPPPGPHEHPPHKEHKPRKHKPRKHPPRKHPPRP